MLTLAGILYAHEYLVASLLKTWDFGSHICLKRDTAGFLRSVLVAALKVDPVTLPLL